MTAKIRAAVHARRDPDTVLIARTDAVAVTGFDDACQRAAACRDAGADVIFVDALQTPEQVQSAAARVGAPLMANMVEQAPPGHGGPPFQHGLPHRHLPDGSPLRRHEGGGGPAAGNRGPAALHGTGGGFPRLQPHDRSGGAPGSGSQLFPPGLNMKGDSYEHPIL
ncbi:isocitrate lyase/phosphoenolpyruvate mutase family protein [uncultured Oscillibacter sp.]|uniref:isocitrate lyase/phosphoenolpyruvate mutase family protein n=1 Tax=uncultured Oscillibacter sp. TaxID=876091 RepID=UPI00345C5472